MKIFEEKMSKTAEIFIIIYWIVCAAFIILISAFVLFLFTFPIVNGDLNDTCEVITEDGVFAVSLSIHGFPDQIRSFSVSHENNSFFTVPLRDCNISLNQEKDSVERYAKIINEYKKDNIRAYEFRWGIIYTLDDGKSFSGVPNSKYSHIKTRDGECFTVYCSNGGKENGIVGGTKIIIYSNYKEIVNIDFEYSQNNRDYYDYHNDFVKNYSWVKKYRKKNLSVCEFNWGIVYTYDGENYSCVLKHEYEEKLETDEEFFNMYQELWDRKIGIEK